MKYIRTKDDNVETIYELQDNGDWTKKGNLCLDKTHFRYEELQNCIIKQADTIEEVCDEFVVWADGYKLPLSYAFKEKEKVRYEIIKRTFLSGMKKKINCWLKLGIWTDKGLIYVAEMNKKGKFKLL